MTLYIFITTLGFASYMVGGYRILKNKYVPNTFSRVVWLLLAVNSFAGVYFSHDSRASIVLALVMLLGNTLICVLSFAKGSAKMGILECLCLVLLGVSVIIWIFFNSPLLNLTISLIAHFIGAIPTYKRVWRDPSSEDIPFWGLFFLASVLTVLNSDYSTFKRILFPFYFVLFDGSIILLAARKFILKPLVF